VGLTSRQVEELLGAWALGALPDDDRAAVDAHLAGDPALAAAGAELQAAAALLGSAEQASPPAGLRERVMATALGRRPPGSSTVAPTTPAGALGHQVAAMADLLAGLDEDGWERPTVTGWTVRQLLAHLAVVEDYTASLLGVGEFTPPPGTEHDHVAMTEPFVAPLAALPPGELLARWRARADATVAHLAGLPPAGLEARVSFHGLDVAVRSLALVRTFEVWTHADDVRRAVGCPVADPPPPVLALMTAVAVGALPLGMAMAGRPAGGRTARVVLTGPGGGTWVQPLGVGEQPGEPDVVVVADAVDFCRLAAKRLDPEDVRHQVTGDADLAADVLVGARVFAA
jgi:uncharacterized protein (TIGR03083 family)